MIFTVKAYPELSEINDVFVFTDKPIQTKHSSSLLYALDKAERSFLKHIFIPVAPNIIPGLLGALISTLLIIICISLYGNNRYRKK
ncbi:MAG: hypothetical protein ACTS78_00800 [Arsenophonus sp. NC-WZS1-MAG3]